jgi:hypothetical protein
VSDWKQSWEERVSELEAEGLTRSDAQGAVDVEILEGWRPRDFQPWMLLEGHNPFTRLDKGVIRKRNTQGLQDMNSNLNQRRI